MNDDSDNPLSLLERSAKLKLFVMLRQTKDATLLRQRLGDHLRWMIDAESQGVIFLSGPVTRLQGSTPLDGLTIVRAIDVAGAIELANADPLVSSGAVSFEMHEWIVNEGSIAVTVSLSDSSVAFR